MQRTESAHCLVPPKPIPVPTPCAPAAPLSRPTRSGEMSPSHSRHSPPTLPDDDIVNVFLLIPPDDPASLVRASLVCKSWRRVLTDPQFCRLYREFHGAPPMLGFVVNFSSRNSGVLSRFIPTTSFRRPSGTRFPSGTHSYPSNCKAVDSRHGRVLIEPVVGDYEHRTTGYIVWDPITNGRWGVPFPRIRRQAWITGAVLCAKRHCDHLGCHGHPFLVTMVGSSEGTTSACVYSSESGVWSDIVTVEHDDDVHWTGGSVLVGSTVYFRYQNFFSVLQYKLAEQKLSVIDVPEVDWADRPVLVSAEDGVMVFAGLRGTRLSLCSAEAGALAWTQRKVIELEKVLPPGALVPKPYVSGSYEPNPSVCGFANGTVFLNTMAGLFTVELSSGRTKKIADEKMVCYVTPWISFYTQDHARRMMPLT